MWPVKVIPVDTASYIPTTLSWDLGTFNTAPGYAGVATDFNITDIQLTGAQAGATFRIEVALCVEYVPANGTAFSLIAKPASNIPKDILSSADRAISALPVSQVDTAASTNSAVKGAAQLTAQQITAASNLANQIAAQTKDSVGKGRRRRR